MTKRPDWRVGAANRDFGRLRKELQERRARPRKKPPEESPWTLYSFTLPRAEARAEVRAYWTRFPPEAYMTAIHEWHELEDGRIHVTMRRLPTAD